jgi:hypothetical protein
MSALLRAPPSIMPAAKISTAAAACAQAGSGLRHHAAGRSTFGCSAARVI